MTLKRILLAASAVLWPTIAFSFSSIQEPPPQSQSQIKNSSVNGIPKESLEKKRQRLSEINATLNELERRSEELASQRGALEAERSGLIKAISGDESEQEFKNSP